MTAIWRLLSLYSRTGREEAFRPHTGLGFLGTLYSSTRYCKRRLSGYCTSINIFSPCRVKDLVLWNRLSRYSAKMNALKSGSRLAGKVAIVTGTYTDFTFFFALLKNDIRQVLDLAMVQA